MYRSGLACLFLTALFLRVIFLGYSPLNHTESENALNAGVVLDCFEKLSWIDGLWKLWHTFLNTNNPLMQAIIFNVPIAAIFGLNELSVRLNAVIGGFFSLLFVYFLIKRYADRTTAVFALILLTFIATLFIALPIRGKVKKDILSSQTGPHFFILSHFF